MLIAPQVAPEADRWLDPASSDWAAIPAARLPLRGTPLGTQPNAYLRASWKGKKVGAIDRVEMRLCHDGERLYVHLAWDDASENRLEEAPATFPDGAAVLFPIAGEAPINTMGNEHQGVNAWHWRADSPQGRSVVAFGVGTTEPVAETVQVNGRRRSDGWDVVLARSLGGAPGTVRLEQGGATRIGIAVWEGKNGERAGFKAYTEEWIDFRLAQQLTMESPAASGPEHGRTPCRERGKQAHDTRWRWSST